MECITPYIGKYDGCSVFLNNGKYGYYLNFKGGLQRCERGLNSSALKKEREKEEERSKGLSSELFPETGIQRVTLIKLSTFV